MTKWKEVRLWYEDYKSSGTPKLPMGDVLYPPTGKEHLYRAVEQSINVPRQQTTRVDARMWPYSPLYGKIANRLHLGHV